MKHIVVIGGGAGGLELVARLGRRLGKTRKALITLVDRNRIHIWKPLLHEVAAGVIDKHSDGIDYGIHAMRHGYTFQLGNVTHIDANSQCITLDEVVDEAGALVLPARTIHYDTLVVAAGSQSNDFGTPGVSDHCYLLDSLNQAQRFHRALVNQLLKLNNTQSEHGALRVAIVGGGATGTELAAQLHHIANLAKAYGLSNVSSKRLEVTIIEAGDRILPALPERISTAAKRALEKLNIVVRERTRVVRANRHSLELDGQAELNADLMVWAAGVKAPQWLCDTGVFETNKINQILVKPTLQSTTYDNIFALGDCCGIQQENGSWVPPRAQSAHQMASCVNANILAQLNQRPQVNFRYRDYGSLVHLSKYSTVGSLMGSLVNSSMFVEGYFARLVYKSLYAMHQFAVHGLGRGILRVLLRKITHSVEPKLKLH